MKFTITQTALAKALSVVSKGMGQNSTMPILSGIYIEAREGILELQSTNLTVGIRHTVPAYVEEPGETVISGKTLISIVKTLPDASIVCETKSHTLEVLCEKSRYLLHTLNTSEWQEVPALNPTQSLELPTKLLSEMVDKVYKITSKEDARPILQGIQLTVEDNTIRLVATDSFRLAVCDSQVAYAEAEPFKAVLPGNLLHEVLGMVEEDTLRIGLTDNQVTFVFGDTTFNSRRIEGMYPDYKRLLLSSCNTVVTLDRESMSAALKRVSVIDQRGSAIRFEINALDQEMRMSASSTEQGDSSETLPCEVEGDSLTLALNFHHLLDCLQALGNAEQVRLELISATDPGVIKDNGKINYLYMIMPVRL